MLNSKDLNDGFRELIDSEYINFKGFSESLPKIAQDWSDIFKNFYNSMILPIPGEANPNLSISLSVFRKNLISAIESKSIKIQLEKIIQNLHFGVCNGVNMLGIYTTTPPSSPLFLQDCFSTTLSPYQISKLLATKIFLWQSPTFSTVITTGIVVKWI